MTPKLRQSIYYLGTIVPGVLGLALIWGGIDAGAAKNIGDILVGLTSLLGAAAPATAAVKVQQQRKDGTLDNLSPAEQVVKSVQSVIQAQASASSDLELVKQAVAGAVGIIPGIGPLASQIINTIAPGPQYQGFLSVQPNTQPDIWRGQRF